MAVVVVVVFFSVVEVTLGASVRDATFGAIVDVLAVVVLGLAATFDAAVAVVFLIGAILPLTSGFFASVGLALDTAADLAATPTAAAATAVVAATAAVATATSVTLTFSITGSDAGSTGCTIGISVSGLCSFGIISVEDTSGSMSGSSVEINCCCVSKPAAPKFSSGADIPDKKSL